MGETPILTSFATEHGDELFLADLARIDCKLCSYFAGFPVLQITIRDRPQGPQ
jgi:hypothetical protein